MQRIDEVQLGIAFNFELTGNSQSSLGAGLRCPHYADAARSDSCTTCQSQTPRAGHTLAELENYRTKERSLVTQIARHFFVAFQNTFVVPNGGTRRARERNMA
jgi:hypothetical protein